MHTRRVALVPEVRNTTEAPIHLHAQNLSNTLSKRTYIRKDPFCTYKAPPSSPLWIPFLLHYPRTTLVRFPRLQELKSRICFPKQLFPIINFPFCGVECCQHDEIHNPFIMVRHFVGTSYGTTVLYVGLSKDSRSKES